MSIRKLFAFVAFGNPVQDAYEKLQAAIRKQAHHIGEAQYHLTMRQFYGERVKALDPHTDWWEFAEAKQKWYEHQEDYTAECAKADECDATVAARREQYETIRKQEGATK